MSSKSHELHGCSILIEGVQGVKVSGSSSHEALLHEKVEGGDVEAVTNFYCHYHIYVVFEKQE